MDASLKKYYEKLAAEMQSRCIAYHIPRAGIVFPGAFEMSHDMCRCVLVPGNETWPEGFAASLSIKLTWRDHLHQWWQVFTLRGDNA